MSWFHILLILALCGAVCVLVRWAFPRDADGDPHNARFVGVVVAILILFVPYTLAWLGAICFTALGLVRLMPAARARQRQAEDAPLRAACHDTHGWHRR